MGRGHKESEGNGGSVHGNRERNAKGEFTKNELHTLIVLFASFLEVGLLN